MAPRQGKAFRYLRIIMVFAALALPLLSLLPLGWLWLWDNGYLIPWVIFALVAGVAGYAFQMYQLPEAVKREAVGDRSSTPPGRDADFDPSWTAREQRAWLEVERVAADVDPATLTSRDAVLALGSRTVVAVARQIHPEDKDPLWKFTVPEALALVERVSAKMRPFIAENIPLGDQLTVGQVLKIYTWRSAIDTAEKAYDLWRIIRLINPITAATQEAREQLTRRLYTSLKDKLALRLAQGYVREVGRAAIDLYGGRLRVSVTQIEDYITSTTLRDRSTLNERAEPVRILIAGQSGSGRSSVVNELLGSIAASADAVPSNDGVRSFELKQQGLPAVLLSESRAVTTSKDALSDLIQRADMADLIVWVASAVRVDRNVDRRMIDAINEHFAARPSQRQPRVLLAVTHIDQVSPSAEWQPPYDLALGESAKVRSINAAVTTVATELGLSTSDAVGVAIGRATPSFNVQALQDAIATHLPEAQRTQLRRLIIDASPKWSLRRAFRQIGNAVKSVAKQ